MTQLHGELIERLRNPSREGAGGHIPASLCLEAAEALSTLSASREGIRAEDLAQRFHETYERLAPSFGYETREASAKPWADVPDQNKRLMIAVCAEILSSSQPPIEKGEEGK